MSLMKFLKSLLGSLPILIIGLTLYFYVVNFSPYQASGALNNFNILVALILLSAWLFFFIRFICVFFIPNSVNKIALIASLLLVQILIISGGFNLVSWTSLLMVICFNVFLVWVALKIL